MIGVDLADARLTALAPALSAAALSGLRAAVSGAAGRIRPWTGSPLGGACCLPAGLSAPQVERAGQVQVLVVAAGQRPSLVRIRVHGRGRRGVVVCAALPSTAFRLDLELTADDQTVLIGQGTTMRGTSIVVEGAGGSLVIGDDCMFAPGTVLRTGDGHPLADLATGDLINPPGDVVLGDRVWLAQDAMVLKGSRIGSGTAVGARSLVVGPLPGDCVAVGAPARPVRTGVRWFRSPDGHARWLAARPPATVPASVSAPAAADTPALGLLGRLLPARWRRRP
jgi:acetyltransferase-like isoleucine patch superfamily enzyme